MCKSSVSSLTRLDDAKTPYFKTLFKRMKKMLLIVAVALVAMSCGNKCCKKECCKDSCCQDTVQVVEAAEAVEAEVVEAAEAVEAPAAE